MRANSRSRLQWGVATAFAALALSALPVSLDDNVVTGKAALADGGGNDRMLAAYPKALPADAVSDDERQEPVPDFAGDTERKLATGTNRHVADDYRIRDDSDIASVEGSANDTEDAASELFDETF